MQSNTRKAHNSRKNRESVSKRIGKRMARWIRTRDNGACVYCDASEGPMHLDHVVARALGGADHYSNLVTACAACNCAKRDLTVRRWLAYLRTANGWTPTQTTRCARRLRRRLARNP